ncbi:MAG: hypothetical protein LBT46_01005 [Planctomycetaceae bacterium]|nr:hypothetical protein [Planctomycetaceae bacterium]
MSIIVLYPCSTFDSLATDLTETEASELLDAWTAAFHPAVLQADVQRGGQNECEMPRWESATYPAYNLQRDIVIVPPCCEHSWTDEWNKQTEECLVIRSPFKSKEHKPPDNIPDNVQVSDELLNAFRAVAVAKLLTDLTARSLHYIDSNNDAALKAALFDAVRYNNEGNEELTKRSLKEVFEELSRMRDNYYPVTNYFVELILVTESTAGEPLRSLLSHQEQTLNLFIDDSLTAALPEKYPETFAALKDACAASRVQWIAGGKTPQSGGQLSFNELPLLDAADRIIETVSLYRETFNVSPVIYGSQHTALTPVLPQLLRLCGFTGVIHFAPLDGWKTGDDGQSKMIWQGLDGTDIDALIRYPADASKALSFFTFAQQLGETLNNDNAPTSVFALFPGQTSPYLPYLRCMTEYTTSLGQFLNIEEYFENTAQCGGVKKSGFEAYPPCETAADTKTGITAAIERLTESAKNTLLTLLEHSPETKNVTKMLTGSGAVVNYFSFPLKIFDADDNAVELPPMGAVVKKKGNKNSSAAALPAAEMPVSRLSSARNTVRQWLPFVSKKDITAKSVTKKSSAPLLIRQTADDLGKGSKRPVYLLENGYFQAKFDAASGMLRSVFTSKSRFNLLSRQLAFFSGHEYSIQAADKITVTKNTPLAGELEITGRLVMPGGTVAARYSETVRVRRESQLLEFSLHLTPLSGICPSENCLSESGGKSDETPESAASYFAVRYAWNDNTFDLCGGISDGLYPLTSKRLTAPLFIDLRNTNQSLTFFAQGLPLHRRVAAQQLDTCLAAVESHYRSALGVNVKHPVPVSQAFLYDNTPAAGGGHSAGQSYWFFQIESHRVVALHWEPLIKDANAAGFIVYLLETEGRRAHFALRMFRNPAEAAAINLLGGEVKTLKTDGDAVLMDIHAHELLPVRVRF